MMKAIAILFLLGLHAIYVCSMTEDEELVNRVSQYDFYEDDFMDMISTFHYVKFFKRVVLSLLRDPAVASYLKDRINLHNEIPNPSTVFFHTDNSTRQKLTEHKSKECVRLLRYTISRMGVIPPENRWPHMNRYLTKHLYYWPENCGPFTERDLYRLMQQFLKDMVKYKFPEGLPFHE